ncbi:glycerophosphodiester phosphodiesterase family protein [Sediminibacillus halophilus]|uniref:Glycerophosphoryl diester phosphodiesterase n=1 Tax=Sediminibacillus halophilus TaxID=482461 RepID=A0A1G9LNZ1_9BACI|nr:glycerophosphodiester phosphodiesterase family protein [Sediminibacillus halophilus]SDL63742.1 glycerophosphoryl diester phosphodiesterase [Sediminibacillus halophilus]
MNTYKLVKIIGMVLVLLAVFMFLNNSSFFTKARTGQSFLLAHRGVAQTFSIEDLTGQTCTAEQIYPPEHAFLENTIPSMKAAFEYGADMVEFDVRPTKDERFAVFHDWTLDCRTNVDGEPSEYTMEELKKIDIGYGYTSDNGESYPFRGKGIGMMPSMTEVLTTFPEQLFLIHIKSDDPAEGEQMADLLKSIGDNQRKRLTVYGGNAPIAKLKELLPDQRVMSKATLKKCLIPYLSVGWTGMIPDSCKHTQLHIPEKYAKWLWGWPDKFLNRMDSVGTRVIVVAGNGKWSEGFDSKADLNRLPENYSGGLWTNRIDKISELMK